MIRSLSSVLILSLLLLISVSFAHADSGTPELMNFNYLQSLQAVGNFYDGAAASNVPNYGVTFNNFWGMRSNGDLSFSPDPTRTPIVYINSTAKGAAGGMVTGTMNVANGFSTGLNFFFTGAFGGQSEMVTVWSGANGTGTVLATLRLYSNDSSCVGGSYCVWTSVSTSFSGTAHSVTFSGPADDMGIADITLGSTRTAIPEPSSIYLLATGVVGVSAGRLRRLFGV